MPFFAVDVSICPICGERLRRSEPVRGLPVFLPAGHSLAPFCDATVHMACFDQWRHRTTFETLWGEFRRRRELVKPTAGSTLRQMEIALGEALLDFNEWALRQENNPEGVERPRKGQGPG